MATLLLVFCQIFELASPEDGKLPTWSELETSMPAVEVEQHLGFDVFAVWTRWDAAVRVNDGWGVGGDVKLGWEWGTPFLFNFKLGYAGWDTSNDPDKTFPGHADIRQYRVGVGVDLFAGKYFDFGGYVNFGYYHFQSRPSDATSRFFELQGIVAVKPLPHLKIGLTGMITFVGTDFNRATTHTSANQSIGPLVELTF
jgi:hypothetical protein